MNDNKKIGQLIDGKKYNELVEVIDDYIDDVKCILHDDNIEELDVNEVYDYTMLCSKIVTTLSEHANTDKEKFLFDGGYFTGMVEELEIFLDKLMHISKCEKVYKKICLKKHYQDILRVLYTRDIVQSKFISEKLKIQPNQLTKIMKEMLENKCIVSYEFSKYKYYGLTWHFKKYLDSIGFKKSNIWDSQEIYEFYDLYAETTFLKPRKMIHITDTIQKCEDSKVFKCDVSKNNWIGAKESKTKYQKDILSVPLGWEVDRIKGNYGELYDFELCEGLDIVSLKKVNNKGSRKSKFGMKIAKLKLMDEYNDENSELYSIRTKDIQEYYSLNRESLEYISIGEEHSCNS